MSHGVRGPNTAATSQTLYKEMNKPCGSKTYQINTAILSEDNLRNPFKRIWQLSAYTYSLISEVRLYIEAEESNVGLDIFSEYRMNAQVKNLFSGP
jgi:hypothetical protein